MMRFAIRAVACAIAIAAAIDPAMSIAEAMRPRIALVTLDPSSPDANDVRASLARDLAADYDVVPHFASDAAAAIVIGARYPDEQVVDSLRVSTVTVPPARDLVRIARVSAPREIPPATAIRIEADVASADAAGRTVEIRARSGGVESGFASHRWNAGEVVWTTTLDVVPVGEPPFVVRVEATMAGAAAGGARAARADLVVHRRDSPIGVEFFDPRPSWASTFVRRALESDPRFRVEALTIDTRGFATRTAGARPLADSQLDSFSVVVAGGIERLSAGDVAALERYLRERGGAVVLLPDQRIDSAPLRALLPAFTERLLEQPAILQSPGSTAPLRASEILVAAAPPPAGAVLARVPGNDGAPVVVTLPRGDGRLLVSGAMDAWRYRAVADAAFDRFWQTTIAGLGLATPPPVDVEVAPPIVRHDQPADVVVRVRGEEPLSVTASAGGQPIRLAPAAERGVYRGRFVARSSGVRTAIDVRVAHADGRFEPARVIVPVSADAQPEPAPAAPLSMLAASHGGIDVTPDRTGDLVRHLRASVRPKRAAVVGHPMRSTWWILPFATCLSTEWWLRRRRGLR